MSNLAIYQQLQRNPATMSSWINSIFQDWPRSSADYYDKTPDVDIREDDNCYYIEADLPGVTENDISITVEHNRLNIVAKSSQAEKYKDNRYRLRERHSGESKRSLVLPKDVLTEEVKARFKHGLLIITVPKSAKEKPAQIPIETA